MCGLHAGEPLHYTPLQHCTPPLQVSYCSPACQKQHWRAHKPHCKPFRVVAVAGKGLGLVATRIIRRAELVIKEQPLLVKVMRMLVLVLVVRMLVQVRGGQTLEAQYRGLGPEQQAALLGLHHDNPGDTLARRLEVIFRANGCEVRLDDRECYLVLHCQGWCGVIGYNPAPADQHPLAQHQVAPG